MQAKNNISSSENDKNWLSSDTWSLIFAFASMTGSPQHYGEILNYRSKCDFGFSTEHTLSLTVRDTLSSVCERLYKRWDVEIQKVL